MAKSKTVWGKIKGTWNGMWNGMWTSQNRGGHTIGGGTVDVFNSQPEPGAWDLIKAYEDTVYSCVTLRSQAVSQVKWKLCVTTSPGENRPKPQTKKISNKQQLVKDYKHYTRKARDVEEVVDYPLLDIFDHPNPHHSFAQILEWTSAYMDICGIAYWYLAKSEFGGVKELREIYVLPTQFMKPNIDPETGLIEYWDFTANSEGKKYYPDEIISFKDFDPSDPYNGSGVSPIRAVWQRNMLLLMEQSSWQAVLGNMAQSGTIISPPPNDTFTEQQSTRLSRTLTSRFGLGNKGGQWVVNDPLVVTPPPAPPQNQAALALYEQVKTSIANVYKVPPALLNLNDETFSGNNTARRSLADLATKPRVHNIFTTITHRLCPPRLFMCADQIVEPDATFELQKTTSLLQANIITVNMALEREGFPPEPGMNKRLYQLTAPGGVGTLPNLTGSGKSIKKAITVNQSAPPDPGALAAVLVDCFSRLKSEAQKKLNKSVNKNFIPMESWTADIAEVVNPVLRAYYDQGSQGMFMGLGMQLRRLPVQELERAVNRASLQLADSTLSTTDLKVSDAIQELRQAMKDGLDEGEAHKLLSERVNEIFTDLETRRAYLIAETESARAKHSGELMAMNEAGLTPEKVWIADNMACPLCEELDGVAKSLDEPFAVEGTGAYSVTDHPPRHPACRCSLQYKFDDIEG